MTERRETLKKYRTTILLSSLKISSPYTIYSEFYGSPYAQNWMFELSKFSQIHSHMQIKHVCSSGKATNYSQHLANAYNSVSDFVAYIYIYIYIYIYVAG